jgi:hypothetical protein
MRSSARANREIGGGSSSSTLTGDASRDMESEAIRHIGRRATGYEKPSPTRIEMSMHPMPRETPTEPSGSAKYRERTSELHVIHGSPLLVWLPVASFTVVMATGIVSVAASDASLDFLASVLRWAALAMLGVLVGSGAPA